MYMSTGLSGMCMWQNIKRKGTYKKTNPSHGRGNGS